MIKISVVIPAYNSERYIRRCIESVKKQTYKAYEIIVIDDGSTDDTLSIVSGISGVKYCKQENSGPSAARNLGIEKSQGDWIALLDSDDEWTVNHLKTFVNAIKKNKEVKVYASGYFFVDENGNKKKAVVSNVSASYCGFVDDYFKCLYGDPLITSNTIIVDKNLMHSNKLRFDESLRYGEDLLLWSKIALIERVYYCCAEGSIYYLNNSGRASKKRVGRDNVFFDKFYDLMIHEKTKNNEQYKSMIKYLIYLYYGRSKYYIKMVDVLGLIDFAMYVLKKITSIYINKKNEV